MAETKQMTVPQILERLAQNEPNMVTSDRALSITNSGEIVEQTDPRGAVLLVAEGGVIGKSLYDDLGIKPLTKAELQERQEARQKAYEEAMGRLEPGQPMAQDNPEANAKAQANAAQSVPTEEEAKPGLTFRATDQAGAPKDSSVSASDTQPIGEIDTASKASKK